MQDGQADDFISFIPDNYIFIGQLAVGRMARLFEIDVEGVGLGVVRRPEVALGRLLDRRDQLQVILDVRYGHSCLFPFAAPAQRAWGGDRFVTHCVTFSFVRQSGFHAATGLPASFVSTSDRISLPASPILHVTMAEALAPRVPLAVRAAPDGSEGTGPGLYFGICISRQGKEP